MIDSSVIQWKKNLESLINLAHFYWEKALKLGGWAIDATCGNGHDTLFLARNVAKTSQVIGIDVQAASLQSTSSLLKEQLEPFEFERVVLFKQSHVEFPPLAEKHPISLIVYNLGYLPKGDKTLTTQVTSTLKSVQEALKLVSIGGGISLSCYIGHEEGQREEEALLLFTKNLSKAHWVVTYHVLLNRHKAPSLIFLSRLK